MAFLQNARPIQTREEYVTNALREAILHGKIMPGEKLDQNEISEQLNVSRSPVREALRALASEGLVELYPHRGAMVASLPLEEIEEIYFIRGILEGMAAKLAAPHMDEGRIALLQAICDEMDDVDDLSQWIELNRRFHNEIYRATNRPRLFSIIESLRNTVTPAIRQYIGSVESRKRANVGHRLILDACVQRDGPRAQQETIKHLNEVCEGVLLV